MTYRWTTKDLDDLETFYREEVAPAMREDGLDPESEQLRYAWMTEHGFSGLVKTLRRDHNLTPTEFYDRLNVGAENDEDYWGLDHDPTRAVLDEYVDELLDRRGHPETTVMSVRSRLKKYTQLYADVNESPDLLAPLLEESERPAEIDRGLAFSTSSMRCSARPPRNSNTSKTPADSTTTSSMPVVPSITRLTA